MDKPPPACPTLDAVLHRIRADAGGGVVVDALAYLDGELSSHERGHVEALIAEEMGRFAPAAYLEELPLPAAVHASSAILRTELARLAAGRPSEPAVDSARLAAPPPTDLGDVRGWRSAVATARSQVEAAKTHTLNVELLHKYGVAAWQRHVKQLERLRDTVHTQVAGVQRTIDTVNRSRKELADRHGPRLEKTERRCRDTLASIAQLEWVCAAGEAELKRRRTGSDASEAPEPSVETPRP